MAGRRSNRVVFSSSLEETQLLGQSLASTLLPNQVVALHGDLGAGKTFLAASIIASLTKVARREIASPTFTYMHMYPGTLPLFHFDLYRIPSAAVFLQMGFAEYFDQGGICLIEWPEKIASLLPPDALHVYLHHEGETRRRIDVHTC